MLTLSSLSGFTQCPDGNHPHFIDLGLPSGKGWACCNVNATTPEDFGGFYAYGEDREKQSYTKNNYLYGQDIGYGYYIWDNIGQRTDISGSAGYDVAYKVMGEDWRMPTKSECEELVDSCTWEWLSINGITGYKVIGPNNNYIFLPAAGFKSSFNHNKAGERGLYRSSMWTMINGEASSSYSIDFTKDGVQVNSLGYRVNGLTVRPISAASMNCFVNSSFLEDQKNKEARGFTADGKSEIAITYKAKNTILDENVDIKFYLDDQEVDETVAGKIKEILYLRDSISVILTAPKDFLLSPGADYKIRIEVTPYRGGKPLSKVGYNYRVLRPGVLFIHGLGDNSSLFLDMINYLVSKDLYIKYRDGSDGSPQLFSVDYHESNTSSFMVNTMTNNVVKGGCETICKSLYESDSIVSAKYDMVGHSMGGILARLYVQETSNGKEHTNSIITLNTPHLGSQLGNIYGWAKRWEHEIDSYLMSKGDKHFLFIDALLCQNLFKDDSNFQAINDLAIGSNAIMQLNGANSSKLSGIPVHAICTVVPSKNMEKFLRPQIKTFVEDNGISGIRSILLERLLAKAVTSFINGIYSEPSDLVVPLSSQKGGLSGFYASEHEGTFEEAMHMFSPHWIEVKNETSTLLQSRRDNTFFSMSGFTSSAVGARSFFASTNGNEYIDHFEEPKEESFISATIIPVAAENYTHLCDVSHSDDMLTYEVFAMPTEKTVVFGVDEKQIQFDLSNVEGDELKFYIVGRTNYDALLLDSVTVNLKADPSGIHSPNNHNEKIYVSYSTNDVIVNIPSSMNGSIWQLYSIDGSFVGKGKTEEARVVLNGRRRGVYILKVTKGNTIHIYKLLFE